MFCQHKGAAVPLIEYDTVPVSMRFSDVDTEGANPANLHTFVARTPGHEFWCCPDVWQSGPAKRVVVVFTDGPINSLFIDVAMAYPPVTVENFGDFEEGAVLYQVPAFVADLMEYLSVSHEWVIGLPDQVPGTPAELVAFMRLWTPIGDPRADAAATVNHYELLADVVRRTGCTTEDLLEVVLPLWHDADHSTQSFPDLLDAATTIVENA